MSHQDKLTILLLLKDRVEYTWRWLRYADETALPHKILIADGGADSQVADVLADKSRFSNLDYSYVRYPYDETLSDFYLKVADALTRVETPYVVLACNDDFCFAEGLNSAVTFLEGHPDYITVGGDMCDFRVDALKRGGPFDKIYGSSTITGHVFPATSFSQASALARLRSYIYTHFNSFPWLAVHRRKPWAESWQSLVDASPGDIRFSDHLIYMLSVAAGKIHGQSTPIVFHQANTRTSAGDDMLSQFPTWQHWIERDGWLDDFQQFIDVVGRRIAESDGIEKSAACEYFRWIYLALVGERVVEAQNPNADLRIHPQAKTARLPVEELDEYKRIEAYLHRGPAPFEPIPTTMRNARPVLHPIIGRISKRLRRWAS